MNRRTILIIILVVAVAVGVYFYMNRGKGEEEVVAVPVPMPMDAPAPTAMMSPPPPASDEMDQEIEEPVGSHPFVGNRFIVSSKDSNAVIVPTEQGNRFRIDTSGARTDDMMVVFEPVEGKENVYFLKSKGLGKYIKYSNNGFGYRSSTPTTFHYKIKFTAVGEYYAMSYVNDDGKEFFFGYDGEKMKSSASVTDIINTGLVSVVDVEVSGFVLPGNFGNNADNYREYGPAEDDNKITDIQGCLTRLGELDLDEEYKASLLSVAHNKDAETPCRAYPKSDSYSYKADAAGWVTTCIDKSKDIKQGCLL
jgi:hypothetical protein